MRLSGRAAVVTGGAAGIGRAVAERLAREGAAVLVADRDQQTGATGPG
jgi:NAD(P)-dependent dehydrogenase (short-subunit alcohol dehydrogenase family)